MTQIQPITYPLSLGIANTLIVTIPQIKEGEQPIMAWRLVDRGSDNSKFVTLSFGKYDLSETQANDENFDDAAALSYVASELGVTIIEES